MDIGDRVRIRKCQYDDPSHNGIIGKITYFLSDGVALVEIDSTKTCVASDYEPVVDNKSVLVELEKDLDWWESGQAKGPYRDQNLNEGFKAGVMHGLTTAINYLRS